MRKDAASTDGVEREYSRFLEARTGRPDSFWRMLMNRDTDLDAEDMVGYGVAATISPLPTSYLRDQHFPAPMRSRAFS